MNLASTQELALTLMLLAGLATLRLSQLIVEVMVDGKDTESGDPIRDRALALLSGRVK